MKKPILLALISVLVLIGLLGGIKTLQIHRMIDAAAQFVPPPETVTTAVARVEQWESLLTSVGSLTAVQGVMVAAEQPGKVVRISFEPGLLVQAGGVLVVQDTSSERAQLPGAEARVALTRSNLDRAENLLKEKIISQAEYDSAVADYRQATAEADNIRSAISKKTIRAPFAGRLGIRLINLGQMLSEGDAIVSLQTLDPIYVNFLLPQHHLPLIRTDLPVRVTTDALPGRTIEGRITAINPEVDAATRNIRVQATVENSQEYLRPGMFANVAVVLPTPASVLAIPATAVLYAPYGDSVFVVEEGTDEQTGRTGRFLRQQTVRLGEQRGDFIAVTEGLKEGEEVVSTGVFKFRSGQEVVVDNTLSPEFHLAPTPANE